MATHELKTERQYFQAILDGTKAFEIRREDDKRFEVGDVLVLRETIPPGVSFHGIMVGKGWTLYTGRACTAEVTYLLRDAPYVSDGYAALGIRVDETCFCQDASDGCDPTQVVGCPKWEGGERPVERLSESQFGETFEQTLYQTTPVQRGRTPLLHDEEQIRSLIFRMGLAFDAAVYDVGHCWTTVAIDHWIPAQDQLSDLRTYLSRLRHFAEQLEPHLDALEAVIAAAEQKVVDHAGR